MNEGEIRTENVPRCPLCEDEDRKVLYTSLRDRLFGAPGEWTLKECCRCGLIYLDPRPTPNEIWKVYATYYTHQHERAMGYRNLPWLILKGGFHLLDDVLGHASILSKERRQIQSMYLCGRPVGRVLDVGCGQGRFLHYMRQAGWVVEGVEPDPKAAKVARSRYGITVHVGDLRSARYSENSFDAVTMNHVIEHVHDPTMLLQECRRILKPEGILVSITPNTRSWGHRYFSKAWIGLDPPRHLCLFTLETMEKCARQAGFENLRTWTTPANAEFMFAGSLDIKSSGEHVMNGRLPVHRLVAAYSLRQLEAFAIKGDPYMGEEVVLWSKA